MSDTFEILAKLDVTKSTELIKKDIAEISKKIQSDKKARVQIISGLNLSKSKSLIQSQLDTISNQIKAPTIKVNLNTDDVTEKIRTAVSEPKDNTTLQRTIDLKAYCTEIERTINSLNKLNNNPLFNRNSDNSAVQEQRNIIESLLNDYQKLRLELQGDISPKGIQAIESALKKLKSQFDIVQNECTELKTSLKNNAEIKKLESDIDSLKSKIISFRNANSKSEKTFGKVFDGMIADLDQVRDRATFDQIKRNFRNVTSEVESLGKTGGTFFETIVDKAKEFGSWMTLTGLISSGWSDIKKMVDNVIGLDTAMTNLKKVTDETNKGYEKFMESAKKTAKELKVGLADLINQEAEWAKKGYSAEETEILGKASGIYSVVGEVDNATSVQHLTTVMKSYNMVVDECMDIVDKFNNISNKYSVDAGDIGEMLSNSISSLSVAGNSLDQAIAMGTTITEITGDASEAGNTLKVLSMRLRGASTEIEAAGESTDGMAESTSKLRDQIKALTNVNGQGGFDIMLDEDTFRSTYDIIQGIANVWKDMADVDQAALLEIIAGKQRGNTVSALLTNMAQANNILSDSLNSDGSAIEEYGLHLDSLEGKIQGFKTAFESLSDTVVNSEFLKFLIDTGTNLIYVLDKIIEKFGALPPLAAAVTAGLSFKNVGELNTPVYVQSHIMYIECNTF